MIDLYVSIISDFTNKIILHTNEHEYMVNFMVRIKESIQMKYEHLRGLSGLKIKEITNVTGIDFNLDDRTVSRALKEKGAVIPIRNRISNHLKNNAHLMCDLDSDDIWIKFKLLLETPGSFVESELEVKFCKSTDSETFLRTTQKMIIQIWNQYWQEKDESSMAERTASADQQHNYVMTEYRIVCINKGTALKLLESLEEEETKSEKKKTSSRVQIKRRVTKTCILPQFPESETIGSVFNYQNNLVKVKCTFIPLRDLFQQQLQLGQINNSSLHSGRADYFASSANQNAYSVDKYLMNPRMTKKINVVQSESNEQLLNITKMPNSPTFNRDRGVLLEQSHDHLKTNNHGSITPFLGTSVGKLGANMISSDNNYHFLGTDGDMGGYEETKENERGISFDFQEESSVPEFLGTKPDQLKIPVMTSGAGPTQSAIYFARNTDNLLQSNIKERLSVSPSFLNKMTTGVGNKFSLDQLKDSKLVGDTGRVQAQMSQAIQNNFLFAIIVGRIILPKRNPIIIEDQPGLIDRNNSQISGAQDSNQRPQLPNIIEEYDIMGQQSPKSSSPHNLNTPQFQDSLLNQEKRGNPYKMQQRITSNNTALRGDQFLSSIEEVAEEHQEKDSSMKFSTSKTNPNSHQSNRMILGDRDMRNSTVLIKKDSVFGGNARTTVINESMVMDIDEDYLDEYKDPNEYPYSLHKDSQFERQSEISYKIKDQENSSLKERGKSQLKKGTHFSVGGFQKDLTKPLINPLSPKLSRVDRNETIFVRTSVTSQYQGDQIDSKFRSATYTSKDFTQGKGSAQSVGAQHNSNFSAVPQATLMSDATNEENKGNKKKGLPMGRQFFSNIFSKLTRGGANNTAQKNQPKSALNDIAIEQISEFEILQRIVLPQFLLAHEDYQIVQIPPIKNFNIQEKEKTSNVSTGKDPVVMQFDDIDVLLAQQESAVNGFDNLGGSGLSRKTFIIIFIIIVLAACCAVGIYFAISLSSTDPSPQP